jgi:hypothetical protein
MMHITPSAAAARANIERHFIPELHRLKIALGAMQLLAAIPSRARAIGDMITLREADLSSACWSSAKPAYARSHRRRDVLIHPVTSATSYT